MRKRGRPKHLDILTPREWEVMEELRRGKSNPEIARSMGISRAGAKYHVSEILGKLGLTSRYEAATWRPVRRAWWPAGALAVLAWPFKSLWWGSTAKVAAAAAVAATVVAFAVPDGFGLFVTDPEMGPVPDFSDFSYVIAGGRVRLAESPARDVGGAWSPDCSLIAFTSNRTGATGSHDDIYTMDPDGTNIVNLTSTDVAPRWSPNGQWLAFTRVELEGPDGYIMRSDGSEIRFVVDGHGGDWSSCKFPGE